MSGPGVVAIVGDAGDGVVPDGQATGQGLHPGVCEAHGRDPPPRRVCGGVRDPLDEFVQVLQAPLAAQVTRPVDDGLDAKGAVFLQVDLDPRVLEAQVDGDLVTAVEQPGREDAGRLARHLLPED